MDISIRRRSPLVGAFKLIALLAAAALAGCGGGGGGGYTQQTTVSGAVAPQISAQPQNASVAAGQTATFSVTATGTAPLSYQWTKNATAISGATSASYTTPATSSSDNGTSFTVTVSNSAGSISSSAATLTVTSGSQTVAPTITAQPLNQTVMVGATATFAVVASGTAPLSYQWSENGAAIAGATSASYTTPATVSGDNGSTFSVQVSNAAGSTTSNAATLTVTAAAVAPTITTQPQNQTVAAGATATFSVVATGTAPLSYQWSKNGTAIAGATSASYTTPATVSGDNGAAFTVAVSNSAGSQTSNSATLTVNVSPTITAQPLNQTVMVGATATFAVVATGTAPLSYQWSKNGTAIAGATSASYTTPATVSGDNSATFTVKVSNSAGSQTSSAATLTVNVSPTITTQPQSQTVTVGATATFSVVATGTAPLSYQWSKNGTAIAGATNASYTTPATVSGDNGATFTVKVSNTAGSTTSNAATLTVSAATVPPTITTQPQSQTVAVGLVATFSVVATGTAPLSYQWSKNGTAIAGATNASYTTPATVSGDNGATFTVKVSNTAGSTTSNAATLTVSAATVPPTITTQPQNQTVTVGLVATFSVVATGTAPLSYQWSKNGTAIAGATSASYTTPATVSGDNGSTFSVQVSNTAGSATSNAATLTVNQLSGSGAPIMFQHIASSTNPAGNGIGGHTFTFHTESLPPNTVAVMGVSALAAINVTISDTLIGSWSSAICNASGGTGNTKASVFVQPLGATGGADTITINVGSSDTQPVQFDITFWENISTTSAANGSLCAGNIKPGSGGSISPGSFTPTTNNDTGGGNVIWNYTPICSATAGGNPTKWVPASGFSLLNADIIWTNDQGFPEASQYSVQAVQGSVTPSITATGDTVDCFNSASVALMVANNGATAPPAIHVASIIHESFVAFAAPGTQVIQVPTVGNLRILGFTWEGGCPGGANQCLGSISSSDGCSWILLGGTSAAAAQAYAEDCSPCSTCTVSITYAGSGTMPQASFRFYDIENAATSSYQNSTGGEGACGAPTASAAPGNFTPTGASSGLTIATIGNGNGPITGLAAGSPAATFDLWTYTDQTDTDLADNADGQAHYYYSSKAAQTWNWAKQNSNDQCYWWASNYN